MDVIEQARAIITEVEDSVEECVLDMYGEDGAEEAPVDDMFKDLLVGHVLTEGPDAEVAREACRMSLGYVPQELQSRLGREDWLR